MEFWQAGWTGFPEWMMENLPVEQTNEEYVNTLILN